MLITTSIIFSIVILLVVTYIVIQDENIEDKVKVRIEEVKEVDSEKK